MLVRPMTCRIDHASLHEMVPDLARAAAGPELHALAMPREGRGEIDDVLLECRRLPGMRLLRIYVPAPALRGTEPLPVVLCNDGHKVFEPANHRRVPAWQQGGTLQLHRLMDGMLCAGALRPAVVVAIATHSGSRADHYVPVRARLGEREFGGHGDAYVDLLEHEVLPAVQRRLANVPLSTRAEHRVLLGASIGGLAAIYGALSRPEVFGAAVALSPSVWVDDGFLTRLVRERERVDAVIAADVGDRERPGIREHCGELFAALHERSERASAAEVDGRHDEDSWRARLPALLQHVLAASGSR